MLDTTLQFLVDEVNRHLAAVPGLPEHQGVRLSGVVDARGELTVLRNSLALTLFQLDEERAVRTQPLDRAIVGGRVLALPDELKLNATLVVSAHFEAYGHALRLISLVLGFFHARPLFTPADSPGLPVGTERLSMDLLSYGPDQHRQLWACLGARQLPSLVYRMRLAVSMATPAELPGSASASSPMVTPDSVVLAAVRGGPPAGDGTALAAAYPEVDLRMR